ncbi:MAG TPA: molybdenum cofactor guanylyltransferase [Ilumatobacteraceae bacterium]|nr:molybdenum cofactor guanylyltransferase [Ilumatobacteraceae bacterium]
MLIGVVLTGGASRRMGRTKALIEVHGTPMASLVANALADAGCESVVLFGGDPNELAPLDRPVLPDRYPGEGPLGGILGVLELFGPQATDLLIVACDLANLSSTDLVALIDAARRRPDADVVVAHGERIEPTCALWRSATVDRVRASFDAGERAVHRVLGDLCTVEVSLAPTSLRNINTPGDLDRYS